MNPLVLTDDLIIGKGRDRVCYRHPSDINLCIKISIKNNKQSFREARYFSFLYKGKKDLSHLSCYRGKVETSLGIGYVFDLVLDHDGQVSKTLTHFFEQANTPYSTIDSSVINLREYLIKNRICVRDISPSNIVYQKLSKGYKLMIIDGVSNPGISPLTIRLGILIKRANDKSWKSFHRKIKRLTDKQ